MSSQMLHHVISSHYPMESQEEHLRNVLKGENIAHKHIN